ncbi:SDR family oxidoreductase [Rubellicoccus peritrichatus]|uniref:dTDP-4-dehydrorhamnose reductase n=1 Tax=Rubellicoccus peritrichatus TaxID=3080537 RepID=A0AAQ3QQZ6_9BACT|nr:SDR family oxidoreductase [Puniceicoccus sp. CR14]WOO40778.1 SDR family oxidoreductase [Puniceicoccus sp. CR14]
MKLIVTGATGLVGHSIVEAALRRKFEVIAIGGSREIRWPEGVTSASLDLSDPEACDRFLLDEFPDVIINAAAASSQTTVDADPEKAEKLNVALPRRLAQLANHLNARLIHFSTDMVFDGTAAPYRSTDTPSPINLYGQLKLMAEREVLKYGGDFATVLRIAIVTGNSPSGRRSVHERLFADWSEGKKTRLYEDEIRQPVSAANVAELIIELCQRPNLHGIFHWAGSEKLSRYEMGRRIAEHFQLPTDLVEAAQSEGNRQADLSMELQPLMGKVRTTPASFEEQLKSMSVPRWCRAWYASIRGLPPEEIETVRLIKGRDF